MVEVTQADREAAAKAPMTFISAGGKTAYDAICKMLATHRIEAAKAERDRIVARLRDDARLTEIEARRILGNLVTLTQADTDDWAKLIAMKHGIADALESQP